MSKSKPVIRRLKFGEAGKFSKSFRQIATTNVPIKQVAEAYVENMERVLSLWELPINLATLMSRWRDSQPRRHPAYMGQSIWQPSPTYKTAKEKKAAEKQQKLDEEYTKYPNYIDYGHDQLNEIFQVMLGPLPETDPTKTVRGCEAILSAMIIGSWTAFETLAGDLWVECLNARPRLGFVALDAEPTPSDDEDTRKAKQNRKYSFPINMLRKWRYNLRNRMGSLLRDKWKFTRRNEAREAYVKVFGKQEEPRLNAIFMTDRLKWLAATRNALVHKGGIADPEFRKLTEGHAVLKRIKEGKPICLSGDLVKEFVDEVVLRSDELAKFVDSWLLNNKE